MKRSTKQLLSLLLTIVMVFGLMAPAMAATPMMGEVAETPVSDTAGVKLSGISRPVVNAPEKVELLADEPSGSVVYKYTLDTTQVLPTSANKTHLAAADLTAVTTLSVDGGAAAAPARFFGITEGEFNDGGTVKAGYVQKRGDNTKTTGIEFAKQAGASVDFTVKGTGKATVTYCSTNGTNISMMALVDDAGAVQVPTMKTAGKATIDDVERTSYIATDTTAEPVSEQVPEAGVVIAYANPANATTVEYTLAAGTYHIESYEKFTGRDGWVTAIEVEDTVELKPVTKVYTLDTTLVLPTSANKTHLAAADLTAVTTVSVDGGAAAAPARFFGITEGEFNDGGTVKAGYVQKRGDNTKTTGIEFAKQAGASVDFTVKGTGKATVTYCSTNGTNISMMALVDDAGAVQMPTMKTAGKATIDEVERTSYIATDTTAEPVSEQAPEAGVVIAYANPANATTVEYTLTAGTYHIEAYEKFTGRDGWVTAIVVEDTYMDAGELEEVQVDWTEAGICGTPTYTFAQNATAGTIAVTVVGPKVGAEETASAILIYADGMAIVMYDKNGTEMGTVEDNAEGNTHKGTFTPAATGKYTFKAKASRDGETDLLSAASDPVEFVLPLKTPTISSASSNGKEEGKDTASVTVSWAKVPEASSYNLYVRAKGTSDWGAATVVPATTASIVNYVVTGLTVDAEYDLAVEAVRAATTVDGVTVPAGQTAKSATVTVTVAGTKQIPWTEIVFGTSTTNTANCVVGEKTVINYAPGVPGKSDGSLGNEVVTAKDGTYQVDFRDTNNNVTKTQKFEGLTGDLNTDPEGRVLLSSRGGAGKIKENEGGDGVLFYYVPVAAGMNYTLTADVEVLRWATRDTQNGVGLAAMDRVDDHSWTGSSSSNSGTFWNNVYMAGAARLGFSYDKKGGGDIYASVDLGYDAYTKYTYYMGLLSIAKNGVPMTANGPWNESAGPATYYERRFPLDTRLAQDGITCKKGSYTNRFNTIGNYTAQPAGFSLLDENSSFMTKYELTKFTVRLQKNNTGYVTTVWDENGRQLGQNIEYFVKGAMDLSGDKPYHDDDASGRKDIPSLQQCLDKDYEYVGLFTSRDLDAVFSNVKLDTIPAEDDAPAVLPPIAPITPSMSISSGNSSNSEDFNFSIATNVSGTAVITMNGKALDPVYVTGEVRCDVPVKLKSGNNSFSVTFTPDPDQELPAFTALANSNPITKTCQVRYESYFSTLKNLYVSPTGRSTAYGTKARPLDIYTAVEVVRPGQNIILLDGVYNLTKTIRINRGMDGCETMEVEVEDVEEKPVLDEAGEPVLDEEGNPVTEPVVTGTHTETVDGRIYFVAEPGAKVVLNGQHKAGSVLVHGSNWWVFKDFEVVGATGTGFQLSGSHNVVQNVKLHDNESTGLQISRLSAGDHIPDRSNANVGELDEVEGITDWGDWPCFNTIINCDSYRNYDNGYNGADGFGAKLTCGEGNVFDGCAAYWNADDGWDLYAKTSDEEGPIGRVTLKNCITFENGYEVRKLADVAKYIPYYEDDGYNAQMNLDADGKIILTPAGNGNGFKLGGSHLPGRHSISNSFAFYNGCKGFDSNNGPDIQVIDCTAYNNGEENVGLSTQYKTNAYTVSGTVSFKDEKCEPYTDKDGNEVLLKDSNPTGKSVYNYYQWNGSSSTGVGTVKGTVTKDSFVSLDWDNTAWVHGSVRDEDGSLNLGDFLKMKDGVNAGAGELVNDVTPVENPEAVVNPPVESPSGSLGGGGVGGGISGNGGTVADAGKKDDETDKALPFVDVAETDWFYDSVKAANTMGLMNGTDATHFTPNMNTTRAMVATILYRLDGEKKTNNTVTFTDLVADWYKDAVIWAADKGVVKGYSDEIFAPNDNVTREQLATMLYRYAVAGEAKADALDGFVDASSVSEWATQAMAWCVANGIITGKGANNLDPQGQATRAEAVTMLVRFAELMKK